MAAGARCAGPRDETRPPRCRCSPSRSRSRSGGAAAAEAEAFCDRLAGAGALMRRCAARAFVPSRQRAGPGHRDLDCSLRGRTPRAAADEAKDEPVRHRMVWNEAWPRFRTVEYGVSALLLIELALIEFRVKQPTEANFTGASSSTTPYATPSACATRRRARRSPRSRILFPIALQAYPLILDGVLVPLLTDRWNFDIAWQMSMMNVMAMGAVGVFNLCTGHRIAARERPSAPGCRRDRNSDPFCDSTPYASFPGGHASGAFLGAGIAARTICTCRSTAAGGRTSWPAFFR